MNVVSGRTPAGRPDDASGILAAGVRVVVVSGRALPDLRRRCRIRGAALSGEHGMSLIGFGRAWVHPATARLHRVSAALAAAAAKLTLGMPGVAAGKCVWELRPDVARGRGRRRGARPKGIEVSRGARFFLE